MSKVVDTAKGAFWGFLFAAAAALFIIALTPHADPVTAKRVLEKQGYTNVEITGANWWNRKEEDYYCAGFKAISPGGHEVTGVVSGNMWGSGNTIRLD